MSGNPFRASIVAQNHSPAATPTSFSPADSHSRGADGLAERKDDSGIGPVTTPARVRSVQTGINGGTVFEVSPAPAKTKKSVRIESPTETIPPHADFGHVHNDTTYPAARGRAEPPSPDSSAAFTDELEDRYPSDPTNRDVDERGKPGSAWKSTASTQSATSPSGIPANPFSRTLATIEPQEKGGDAGQPKGS